MKRILIKNYLPFAALVIGLTGCDIFQKDADVTPGASQTIDMYVLQNKAAVIDLNRSFPNFGKVVLAGTNANVKYIDDRYIKYQSLNGKSDAFAFSVVTSNNQKMNASVTVHTDASDNCGNPFTYAKIKKDSKLVVNLFNNPEFCSYDIYTKGGGVAVSDPRPVDVQKNLDGILLAIWAGGVQGNTAILSYDPPKGFVGQVIGKYYLGIPIDSSSPIPQDDFYNPARYKYYSVHEYTIDVVEDL